MTELTLEQLQKYLDDNNITFEEYVSRTVNKEFVDKVWMDAIYSLWK